MAKVSRVMVLEKDKRAWCDNCEDWTLVNGPLKAMSISDFRDIMDSGESVSENDIVAWFANQDADMNDCDGCGQLAEVTDREPLEKTQYLCRVCGEIFDTFAEAHQCCG